MRSLPLNLEKAKGLVEIIGVENIWEVDVSEYSVRILAYEGSGVEQKALKLGFKNEDATHFVRENQTITIALIK